MDAQCILCGGPSDGYGHFYKHPLDVIWNAHKNETWCHTCNEEQRAKSAALFKANLGEIKNCVLSLCPIEGCGKPMLYEEGTELPPMAERLSSCIPKTKYATLIVDPTSYVSTEGNVLCLATRVCQYGKERLLVFNDTGRRILPHTHIIFKS